MRLVPATTNGDSSPAAQSFTAAQSSQQRWDLIRQAADSPTGSPAAASSTAQSPIETTNGVEVNETSDGNVIIATIEGQNLVRCGDCGKPIFESAIERHAANCQKVRDRKQTKLSNGSSGGAGGESGSAPHRKRRLSDASQDSSSTSPDKKKIQSGPVLTISGGSPNGLTNNTGGGGSGSKDKDAEKEKEKEKEKAKKLKTSTNNSLGGSFSGGGGGGSGSGGGGGGSNVVGGGGSSGGTSNPPFKNRPGPVDVDKQCGVINDKGFPCSRSLTCKSHSMGAKRSVPHRSQPYDILLNLWLKATKPDFGDRKPVQPRVGPGSEAYNAAVADGRKRKRSDPGPGGLGSSSGAGTIAVGGTSSVIGAGVGKDGKRRDHKGKGMLIVGEWDEREDDTAHGYNGYAAYDEEAMIDSEEEVEAVLKGIGRVGRGKPLGIVNGSSGLSASGGGAGLSAASMFVNRNLKLGRLREVLGGVFGVGGVPGAPGAGGPTAMSAGGN